MEISEKSPCDPAYIEKKREELKIFFKGINLSQEQIDKIIENELRPLMDNVATNNNRPYIEATFPGEVKSEYEIMTGQPFTKVEDHNKPLTSEEIRKMLNDNPLLVEKARQIQINNHERKVIALPLENINIDKYKDMRKEIDGAGSQEEIDKIHYKHMCALMNSVVDFKNQNVKLANESKIEKPDTEESDSDTREFEAIEKVVSKYTNKSYETRFQETKEMLLKMADKYDDPDCNTQAVEIDENHILKESSVQIIEDQSRKTAYEEIKEHYLINEAINITLKDNPVTLNLSGEKTNKFIQPEKTEKVIEAEKVLSKSLEVKLKDTEKQLREITSVFDGISIINQAENNKCTEKDIITPNEIGSEISSLPANRDQHDNSSRDTNEKITNYEEQPSFTSVQKFDQKLEQTLYNALEDILEISHNENEDNKELEFKEMKNLAQSIVEGAENLSTLIHEDITNKLNSMNELLNDVNEALENSKKSNIAYQKIKQESETLRKGRQVKLSESRQFTNNIKDNISNVLDSDIDEIYSAIGKINTEIKIHEETVNKSKENYELRNEECKTFMMEIDDVLLKSQQILHPVKTFPSELKATNSVQDQENENNPKRSKENNVVNETSEKIRKEIWDIDIEYKDERNRQLAEFKRQELERNKRINDLLYDIKDKMKDNKEVLRLANNLLHREETRKKTLEENTKNRELPTIETDARAKGDHARVQELSSIDESKIPLLSGVGEGVKGIRILIIIFKFGQKADDVIIFYLFIRKV